jgi:hypothetical protein
MTRHLLAQILTTTMVTEKSRLWVLTQKNLFFNPFKAKNTLKLVLEHVEVNLAT